MKGEGHAVLDIIPVDIVVNLLISSAWFVGTNKKLGLNIYHCTTGDLHPFRWGEMESFVTLYSKNIPFEGAFRRPNLTLTSNSLVHDYWVFISHLIPAYMSDLCLTMVGQKPRVVNVYKNIHKMLSSIEYLTQLDLKCSYESVISLRNSNIENDSVVSWFFFKKDKSDSILNAILDCIPFAISQIPHFLRVEWWDRLVILFEESNFNLI